MATSQNGPGWFDEASAIEWVRAFVDHHCIFRSPPGKALLTNPDGGRFGWQFYFPIATFDQRTALLIGRLFWRRYLDHFHARPFQLAGCESGGMPVMAAIQSVALNDYGIVVNGFEAKKAAKTYGLRNWLEGIVLPTVPVVVVDDVIGGARTLTTTIARLRGFGLEIVGAFAVASCKRPPPLELALKGGETVMARTLLGPQDFARTHERYVAAYKRQPQFKGTVV